MQIGTIAKRMGLSADAIRFYERSALLPLAPRTPGGFRQYGDGDVEILLFIRRAQGLGFTLDEIRELLGMRQGELRACSAVRARLKQKLACVRAKLTDLENLERELHSALRSCDGELRKRSARCPFFRAGKSREGENTR
jgi:DNA-binding transcriptional MerR regulator